MIEPELRSETAFSRLIPDLSGWRRSTTGWPDLDDSLIGLMPEWVAEILSPGTMAADKGVKREAYGLMGIGHLWLVDPDDRTVEAFVNVRGQMRRDALLRADDRLTVPPFDTLAVPLASLFP